MKLKERGLSAPAHVGGHAPAIRHNVIRDAMAEVFGVAPAGREALGTRIRALLGLGLRRDPTPAPGSGRGHRNVLHDALDVALALTLQRAFVPPVAVAALIVGSRAIIDRLWAEAAMGRPASLTVEIDALSQIGRPGMRSGPFSEDPAGTLALVCDSRRTISGCPVAPPRIEIDLRALHDAVTAALQRAGAAVAACPRRTLG